MKRTTAMPPPPEDQPTKQPKLPERFKSKSVVVPTNSPSNAGETMGTNVDDWLQAESEVTQPKAKTAAA